MLNIREINLFRDATYIEEIEEGYPKRKKYKVTTPKCEYFIKIHDYKMSNQEIQKEKWLYQAYENSKIPIVPLLDVIRKDNNTIFIYPFFKGKTLKKANLSKKEFRDYGIRVAKDVIKINHITYDSNLFKPLELEEHFKEDMERGRKLWRNSIYRKKILQIFTKQEIRLLFAYYRNLLKDVKKEKVMLNHNDIKTGNIMLDKQKNYFFIDIDPINLTVPGYNMYYSLFWFLLPNCEEKEKCFLKGFIQTLDPQIKLLKQLHYFLISDFMNELEMLLNEKFDDLMQENLRLKQMLFNENNIIEKVIYEND